MATTTALKIRGAGEDTSFGKRVLQNQYPLIVIARSNLSLFEAILGCLVGGAKTMHFEGGHPR